MAFKLYPDQEAAVEQMHNGCILCGGVGSGKSLTSLGYFKKVLGKQEYKKILFGLEVQIPLYIITTARKRDNLEWEKELAKFAWSTNVNFSFGGQQVFIDSWNNIAKYENVKDAFFIFDEQRVSGAGKWSKEFIKLAKANQWILLSATPGDTWMDYIPVFIANGFYKNRTEFIREHVVFSRFTKFPKVERYLSTNKLARLRDSLLVNIATPVQHIRHRIDIAVRYDIKETEMLTNDLWNPYKNRPIKNISELCFYLRKATNSNESRQEAIDAVFKNHPKLIVFYNFDYELDILKAYCRLRKHNYAEWNGHKHQDIPDTDSWIYLVQYTSGCEGWNCTKTDTVLFYSLSYSYKQMEQAAGRIDRRDSPYNDLYYYYLISKSKIDISVNNCLKRKKTFNSKMFANSQKLQML